MFLRSDRILAFRTTTESHFQNSPWMARSPLVRRIKVDRKQIFYSDFHFLCCTVKKVAWAFSSCVPPVYNEPEFLFLSPIHLPSPPHLCFLWRWCCVCPSPSLQQSSSKRCGRRGCRQCWCLQEAGHWLSTGTGRTPHRRECHPATQQEAMSSSPTLITFKC